MKRTLSTVLALGWPGLVYGQDIVNLPPGSTAAVAFGGPQLLMSVLAGIVLAIGFQFLLTNLSIAAGVTALGAATKPSRSAGRDESEGHSEGLAGTVQKFTRGLGIWTMATAALALFFASWLAVELSLTDSRLIGAVLGMVIWGLFYLVVTTVEMTALSSIIGSVFRTASSGVKASFRGVSSAVGTSPETRMADSAKEITAAVRQELFGNVTGTDLRKQLTHYLDQISASQPDPAQIRKELAHLLDNTEMEAVAAEGDWNKVVASFRSKPALHPEKAKKYANVLKDAFSTIRSEASSDKGRTGKVADAALQVAGLGPQEAQAVKDKVADYLRKTGKEELRPEAIERDFEVLLSDPKAGKESLKRKLAQIDRSTIAGFLAQRKDLSREEAERMVERVNEVIQHLNRSGGEENQKKPLKERAIGKIEDYLNSLDRPELKFDDLEGEVERLLHDPKAEAHELLNRAKSMDRETIKAVISSKKDMSPEDAERMIQRIERARDSFVRKAERMKAEVEKRTLEMKHQALNAAEESRKAAATAAWWAFGTALVSVGFAALGGIVAVATGA